MIRRITADTALRLAKFFNMSAQFWLGLHISYIIYKKFGFTNAFTRNTPPFVPHSGAPGDAGVMYQLGNGVHLEIGSFLCCRAVHLFWKLRVATQVINLILNE